MLLFLSSTIYLPQSLIILQSRKLIQSQRHICSSFSSVGLFILSLLISSLSPLTSLPAYPSEVRDDCSHWLCLSAWVIHGNGKVQTGAVGVHDFPLFFLLSTFFLKSLTWPKLKKLKVPERGSFPPYTETTILCSLTACAPVMHRCHAE